MRHVCALACLFGLLSASCIAVAAECPGNPNALGTSRVISVDPTEHARVGAMQYPETLPLDDHEVVLTFDDGPLPPHTTRILDMLAAECVKATFFVVGVMANGAPKMVRRAFAEGHTIGTHTQHHPFHMARLPIEDARNEIDEGIASVAAALGDPNAVAPFLRIPGLGRSPAIEDYAQQRGLMIWSGDFGADDWTHIGSAQVTARAIERIERKGRGMLVLHDIQPATARALPDLLGELRRRGYRIVHVVPVGADMPKTVTAAEQWALHR